MNQKLINGSHAQHHPPKVSKEDLAKIEDIKSDADTFPEFSNRDGSRESTVAQLTMVRIPHLLADNHLKIMQEAISAEMHTAWKTPQSQFAYFTAPHIPLLQMTHGIARKYCGDKVMIRSSHFFSEPRNEKFFIAKDSDVKALKFEVVLGHSRFSWDKPETHHDIQRRIEGTLNEVVRVLPNVVIVLGPHAFDILYESLDKQKRKSNGTKKLVVGAVVENFKREDNKWKRIPKTGATSISVPLKGYA